MSNKVLIAAAGIVAVAVLVLGGVLVARRSANDAARSPAASPSQATPTPSPSASSASPSASAIASPSPSASPSANPAVRGTALTASGAELTPPAGPAVVAASRTASCNALVEAGWSGSCGTVETAGGRIHWVVQKRPVPDSATQALKVRLFVYRDSAGGWAPALEAVDAQGELWSDATVRHVDLTGDGKPEIVVGMRYHGSGSNLGLNVVEHRRGGTPNVLAHPDILSHGAADVSTGRIDEYAAEYPNNEPNCCPPHFRHRVIRWDGTQYRAERVANVATPPAGDFE